MTLLEWRDANLRGAADKKALQVFRCTDEDLKTEITALGATTTHSRIWEWHVQQLIQADVRALTNKRWIVRLGYDSAGLGGVIVAQEIKAVDHYDVTLGAIASRLRRRHDGRMGDEMMEDMLAVITRRCTAQGYSGDVSLTGMIHRDNFASKRMCERNGFVFDGPHPDAEDHEVWVRPLTIPGPPLFE